MTNEYAMSPKKFFAIVIGAVVTSAVITVFAMLRMANSDHFTIIANADDIETNKQAIAKIEQNHVSRAEFDLTVKGQKDNTDRIEASIKELVQRFDRLLETR